MYNKQATGEFRTQPPAIH